MPTQKIKYTTTLKDEHDNGKSSIELGNMMGLTSHAVRTMLKANRHILMVKKGKQWHYTEVRPWRSAKDNLKNITGRPMIGRNPDFTEEP